MGETCRKGLLYNGVCYQEALSCPGGPLAELAPVPHAAVA